MDHNQLLRFKDTGSDVRTNVPILDGISYLKGITKENPMLVRANLASSYIYGTVPETGAEWWRPTNFSYASEVTTVYTERDVGGGVSSRG